MNEDKLLDAVELYVDRMSLDELMDYAVRGMYDEMHDASSRIQLEFIDMVNRGEE